VFGYRLLWCFLAAGLFKAIQVYAGARHLTLTGEHPMKTWTRLPGPVNWFPLLIAVPTVLVMPIAFSGISEILGGYVTELSGVTLDERRWVGQFPVREFWSNLFGSVVLVVCLLLALGSSQTILERVSAVVIGLIVVSAIVSVIASRPDVMLFLQGLFVPAVPDYEPWVTAQNSAFVNRSPWLEVALYLSAVGGGTFDYIGYLGMLREKNWGRSGKTEVDRATLDGLSDEQIRRAKIWTRAPLMDTLVSFTSVIVVTLLFATLGAAILHSAQSVPEQGNLLSAQEEFLTSLHPSFRFLYRGGVFLAFIGTLYGAFEIYRHTVAESVMAIAGKRVSKDTMSRVGTWTVLYCFLGGLAMVWLPSSIAGNVVSKMTFGAVLGGATLCGLWCFAILWADQTQLPKQLRMNLLLKILTAIGGLAMTALGIQTLVVYFHEQLQN
jgi:Mn2+/Fe2+ NRAMP family transporter